MIDSEQTAPVRRIITLAEEDHVLLSGDPDRKHEIVTVKIGGAGVGIRSWYWSNSEDGYVQDPESGIQLSEDEFRVLALEMPSILQRMTALFEGGDVKGSDGEP